MTMTPAPIRVRVRVLAAALVGIAVGVLATVAVMVSAQDGGQGASSPLEARVSQLEARMTGAATLFTAHDRRLGALETAPSHDHDLGPFETITLTGTGSADLYVLEDVPEGRYRATLTSFGARGSIATPDGFGSSISVQLRTTRPTEFTALRGRRHTFEEGEISIADRFAVVISSRDERYPWTLVIERIGDLPTGP